MRALTPLSLIPGNLPELRHKDIKSGALKIRRAHHAVRPNIDVKSPKSDGCIDALKVLARALLDEIDSLPERTALSEVTDLNLQAQVRRFEAQLIRSALIRTGGRQRRAARLLGTKATTLNAKIRRYGI